MPNGPARRGRPPPWHIDAGATGPPGHEVVSIDSRARVSVPAWLAKDATWFKPPALLGVLEEIGRMRALPWPEAQVVIERRQDLLADPSAEAVEALQQLDDRYFRIPAEKIFRLTIPRPAVAHLGVKVGDEVLVLGRVDVIEIWSLRYREERLLRRHAALEDLP